MKTLAILRHAKSPWPLPGMKDIDRPLNDEGREQLAALSIWIASSLAKPDVVITSPAQRTIETLDGIRNALGDVPEEIASELYNASVESCLDVLASRDENTILLVGHNPSCDELVRYLAKPSGPKMDDLMAQHFSTATLAVLKFDGDDWNKLGESSCDLVDLVSPRDLD